MSATATSLTTASMLPDVMSVLDHVEAETSLVAQRREALIQAVTRTCSTQQIPASAQTIAQAVDQHLSLGPVAPSRKRAGRAVFGWARPASPEALVRHRKGLRARLRAHGRHLVEMFATYSDDGPKFGWSVAYGLPVNAIVAALSWGVFHAAIVTILASVFGAFIWPMLIGLTGGLRAVGRLLAGPDAKHDPLEEARMRESELRYWASLPETRAYARKCFLSDLPYLLVGDEQQLKALCRAVEDRREEERRVQQRLAMQAIFFVASDDEQTAA
jgi:hypothetical protein